MSPSTSWADKNSTLKTQQPTERCMWNKIHEWYITSDHVLPYSRILCKDSPEEEEEPHIL